MSKIDLHVIRTPRYDKNMERMLTQLDTKIFDIHICDRVEGNIALARHRAYSKGSNEYQTFIDPDDKILDLSWISSALDDLKLNNSLAACAGRYKITYLNKQTRTYPMSVWNRTNYKKYLSPPLIHHLTIMRRENLEKIFSKLISENFTKSEREINVLTPLYGDIKIVDNICYNWILRPNSAVSNLCEASNNRYTKLVEETCKIMQAYPHH